MIDQSHTHIRQLAQQLGLRLDNLHRGEANGTEPLYYFDGTPYTYAEASDDLNGIYQKLHRDVSKASYPTLFDLYTPRGFELDHMSIVDWIEESVPGGITSELGQLLSVAYNIEYGAESSDQSSLNLLYLLGYSGQGQFRMFGQSNEKYHVRGGNDQIPSQIAAAHCGPDRARSGTRLRQARIRRRQLLTDVSHRRRHEDRSCRPRRARTAVLDPSVRRSTTPRQGSSPSR